MAAVTNGAELLKRLKATRTPDQRMKPGRDELLRVRAERNEVANSAQIIAALEEAYGPDHMTVVKAKAIAATGAWSPPPQQVQVVAVEEEFLAADAPPVSAAAPRAPRAKGRTRRAVESKKVRDAEPAAA